MTKTPEQMAEEYADLCVSDDYYAPLKAGFLAGYEAAKDQLQPQPFHAGADVYIIDANNPLPKPMPLSIAEQFQFANTSKVMNSPNNSNGWISVKERLPEEGQEVLVSDNNVVSIKSISFFTHKWHPYENGFNCEPSHWMLLPKPPEDK